MARTVFATTALAALTSTVTCAPLHTRGISVVFQLLDPYPTFGQVYNCDTTNTQGAGVQCFGYYTNLRIFSSGLDCQILTKKPCVTIGGTNTAFENWWQDTEDENVVPTTGPMGDIDHPTFTLIGYQNTDPASCYFSCALTTDNSESWKCVSDACELTRYSTMDACQAENPGMKCITDVTDTFINWYMVDPQPEE